MNSGPFAVVVCCAALLGGCRPDLGAVRRNCVTVDRTPEIRPDYAGVTIPPNIAPLNFSLRDSCSSCVAEIASVNGPPITVTGKKGVFRIGAAPWRRLLSENAGNALRVTIYARDGRDTWRRYASIENTIAPEPIDRYCTYRLLNFQYNYWRDLRMCQRDLTSFSEKEFLNTLNYTLDNMRSPVKTDTSRADARTSATRTSGRNGGGDSLRNGNQGELHNEVFRCVNCHMPMNNDPARFALQFRSIAYGSETLLADGDSLTVVSSRFGQTAWHPGGRIIAFSVYTVQQYFHAVGRQFIDVFDNRSRLVVYDVAGRKLLPVQHFGRKGVLDAWPAWSPDGRYLYYCGSPVLWSDYEKEPPDNFNRTKFSLLRISYDAASGSWGEVDTVLSSAETGLSVALPRLSPDNRFCLFCMQDYGAYPYTEQSSDLYLMDVASRRYFKLPVNSEYNESWHSWSANGRWIIFSSRRDGGIFTRLYISHIDSAGNGSKPFILPQVDPSFYDSFVKCYNVAEFAVAPVRIPERKLIKAIRTQVPVVVPIPPESEDLPAGTSP